LRPSSCLIAIFSSPFHLFAAAAPISPFIARITPGRLAGECAGLNRDQGHSDQLATIYKSRHAGFESLTARSCRVWKFWT
jgi:hypothetical protein